MTDTAPEVTKTKKRNLALPIAAGVVAIAVGGFLVSRAGLDKALVKEQVDAFIANAQAKAKESGRDLTITYKDIEIEGGFTNRHAVVKEPAMLVNHAGAETGGDPSVAKASSDAVKISTSHIDIYPESADLSSLRVEAPAPLTFTSPSKPDAALATVTSNAPLSFSVAQSKQGEVVYSDVTYRAPTETEFKYLKETQAAGEEDKTQTLTPVYETVKITLGAGSGFSSSIAQNKSGLGQASLHLTDLTITPGAAPESAVKAPKVAVAWSNVLNEKQRNVVKATMDVGPVTSANAALPYQPVTVALDASFEGTIPNSPQAVSAAQTAEPSVLALKTFTVATKDSTFSATADFTAAATDAMPVGKATIGLTNLPYVLAQLRESGNLDEKSEPMVAALLQKISGTPMDQLKDLNIVIDRSKDGPFKVGSTTFEELFATVLGGGMNNQAPAAGAESAEPPHVPQLPPAEAPKAAPIEVPNHGDRG